MIREGMLGIIIKSFGGFMYFVIFELVDMKNVMVEMYKDWLG